MLPRGCDNEVDATRTDTQASPRRTSADRRREGVTSFLHRSSGDQHPSTLGPPSGG
ncbi:MAG: hypothetical protein AVDCRST_MAG20-252 [uncultured Acidimicrobiales bacterium]|uniref:Uncharacterized protein n=1 Tax=uncultured Acidimicrobiales bacterium TaxID=310071 RepID=A0A6J4H315_9ACTN|nr:MAG: hypothetical protein AVDCRST_MAG20-252 [uncultured Acidimicrobiales bacterium]